MTGSQWYTCILCHSTFPENRVRKMLDRLSTMNLVDSSRAITDRLQKAKALRRKLDKLGYN